MFHAFWGWECSLFSLRGRGHVLQTLFLKPNGGDIAPSISALLVCKVDFGKRRKTLSVVKLWLEVSITVPNESLSLRSDKLAVISFSIRKTHKRANCHFGDQVN